MTCVVNVGVDGLRVRLEVLSEDFNYPDGARERADAAFEELGDALAAALEPGLEVARGPGYVLVGPAEEPVEEDREPPPTEGARIDKCPVCGGSDCLGTYKSALVGRVVKVTTVAGHVHKGRLLAVSPDLASIDLERDESVHPILRWAAISPVVPVEPTHGPGEGTPR